MSGERQLLCLMCSEWFQAAPDLRACPGCGDTGVPAASDDMVTVKITWHELRCLVMWAEQWAYAVAKQREEGKRMQRVIYGIADRLTLQHQDARPLTMAGEIAQIREAFGPYNIETHGIPEPPE